jgi:hypothetical protein
VVCADERAGLVGAEGFGDRCASGEEEASGAERQRLRWSALWILGWWDGDLCALGGRGGWRCRVVLGRECMRCLVFWMSY